MNDQTLIKQRNQLMVKAFWIFLSIDLIINLILYDFSTATNISVVSVPPLLLITYLVKKKYRNQINNVFNIGPIYNRLIHFKYYRGKLYQSVFSNITTDILHTL